MEALQGLRYKAATNDGSGHIRRSSYIYSDNMLVIHNTQGPESVLKNKSNSICYHAIREAVAMGECVTGHKSTHDNPADLCTKIMSAGMKRDHHVGLILRNIADHA